MITNSYLDRLLEPVAEAFTPEVARALVDVRIDPQTEAHIEVLRRKAEQDSITPEEDAEYKDFVDAVDVLSIIQAKARRFLSKRPA